MRFNPPPNWPRPPAGWTPPPGWAPDPAWGDGPPGWQYWLPDPPPIPDPPPLPDLSPEQGRPDGGAPVGFDEPPPLPGFTEQPTVPIAAAPTLLSGPGESLAPPGGGLAPPGEHLVSDLPPIRYPVAGAPEPAAAPPRRRLRRAKVLVPTTVVLVAALTGGGLYGNQVWQERQERLRIEKAHQRLKDAYAAGHAAFLAGDCTAADPQFSAVDDPVLEPDLTERATAEKAACAKLELTRGTAGDPAAKVVAYLDYLFSGPGEPLQPVATKEVAALFTATPVDRLASTELCNRLEALDEFVLTTDAARAKSLPGLLLRCSDLALKDGDAQAAEDGYRRLREEYAKTAEAGKATTALAKLIVADGKAGSHGTVGPPPPARSDSGLGDQARLVVYNGTPQELQLTLSGSSGVIGTATECSTCKVFATRAQARCAFKGPHVTLTVPAGKYQVDLRFPDRPTRPAVGSWTLRGGRVYEACFYVSKS